MGVGETANRRALIEKVKECVGLANTCNAGVADVQKRHNTFVELVDADMKRCNGRIDTQGKWLARLEREQTYAGGTLTTHHGTLQRHEQFIAHLTFLQRVRWLLTGRVPVIPVCSATAPTGRAAAAPETGAASAAGPLATDYGVMPAVSYGPRVLP